MTLSSEPTKSTQSHTSGCVEVSFADSEWQAFLNGVHDGEFDLPATERAR